MFTPLLYSKASRGEVPQINVHQVFQNLTFFQTTKVIF